jgi:hypothetical protein
MLVAAATPVSHFSCQSRLIIILHAMNQHRSILYTMEIGEISVHRILNSSLRTNVLSQLESIVVNFQRLIIIHVNKYFNNLIVVIFIRR